MSENERIKKAIAFLNREIPEHFSDLTKESTWQVVLADLEPSRFAETADDGFIKINRIYFNGLSDSDLLHILLHESVHSKLQAEGVKLRSKCSYFYHELLAYSTTSKYEPILQSSDRLKLNNLIQYEFYNYKFRNYHCDSWFAEIPRFYN